MGSYILFLWGDLLVVITGITRAITVQHVVTGITGLGPLGRYVISTNFMDTLRK